MTTKKEIAIVLRAAKFLLPWNRTDSDKSPYICDNIYEAGVPGNWKTSALNVIKDRIGNFFSVEEWLIDQGYIEASVNPKKLQEYRHAWLDSMIKEFEGKA